MERMNTPELEEEKRCGPRNWGLEAIKVSWVGVQGGQGWLVTDKSSRALCVLTRARRRCGGAQWI